MEIIFKPATTGDVVLIQQLANTIWYHHYPGILTIEQIDYMLEKMYAAPVILAEIEKGYRWTLVFEGDQPIGFIEFHKEEKQVKLSKLYILSQYHQKGIGQACLGFVKKEAKKMKAEKLYLTVNRKNIKAIEAYKKASFEVEKEMVFDIGNGYVMDDFIMSYSLSEEDVVL